jgi:hypothetical protein
MYDKFLALSPSISSHGFPGIGLARNNLGKNSFTERCQFTTIMVKHNKIFPSPSGDSCWKLGYSFIYLLFFFLLATSPVLAQDPLEKASKRLG